MNMSCCAEDWEKEEVLHLWRSQMETVMEEQGELGEEVHCRAR